MYPCCCGFMQGAGLHGEAAGQQMYPFCRTVFASWEFHAVGKDRCQMARRALRSQLKEMVSDSSVEEVFVTPSARRMAILRKVHHFPALLLVTCAFPNITSSPHNSSVVTICSVAPLMPSLSS